MNVRTVAIGLIIYPVAFVNITIHMNKLAMTMGSVVLPLTFVPGPIWPDLDTDAISETSDPLASVCGASFECVGRPLFTLRIGVIALLGDCFFGFIHRKVLAVCSLGMFDEVYQLPGTVSSP
jgi:hypothetical protein